MHLDLKCNGEETRLTNIDVMDSIKTIQYEFDKQKETCEKYQNTISELERKNKELTDELLIKNYDVNRCHYVYLLINKNTDEIYVGMRSSDVDPYTDNYYGSGKELDSDKSIYKKIILAVYDTREQAQICEAMIVNDNFMCREDTINIRTPLPTKGSQLRGIKKAKREGKYKGRQVRFSDDTIEQIKREFDAARNRADVARKYGISRSYLYKLVGKD